VDPDLEINELIFLDESAQPVPTPSNAVGNLQVIFGYEESGRVKES
jgi:hypothetical protein